MSEFVSPVFYSNTQDGIQQQVGRAIARYSLFPFLNNQTSSKLLPFVLRNLPSVLGDSVQHATSKIQKQKGFGFKKRFINSLVSGALNPVTNFLGGAAETLGGVLLDGIESGVYAGSNYVLRDGNWGTSTIKTSSLKGDVAWSTVISFGSNSQPLRINIDSGSSDLFLFDPSCTNCGVDDHSAFDHYNSTSFLAFPNSDSVLTYVDGSRIEGYVARDLVSLNGQLVIQNQTLGMATKVSDDWKTMAIDGIMGIGPDSLSAFNVTDNRGVFTQMIASGQLRSPVIGIALVKSTTSDSAHGTFSFGTIDENWIQPDEGLAWRNVTSHNFWGIDLSGVYANGQNLMADSDPPRAIMDTGTSLILVTEALAVQIHTQIPGSQVDAKTDVWLVPCSIKSDTSDIKPSPNIFFEFGIGREKFGIPAADMAYSVVKDYPNSDVEMCYSGVQSGGENFVVLGDLFLKNHYVAFKYGKKGRKLIGIANRTDLYPLY